MSEDKVEEVKEEPVKGNPQLQEQPKPVQDEPQSSDKGTVTPNPEEELVKLKESVDTLKRQYAASSEEALRLKGKNDELEAAVKVANESQIAIPKNDEEFNQRVEKVGLVNAILGLVQEVTKPNSDRLNDLVKEKVDKTVSNFKSKHPGLKDEILVKFDKEFNKLKGVYDNADEALEAAYSIVGGKEADALAELPAKDKQAATDADAQSEVDKKQVLANASGENGDKKVVSSSPQADITATISKLTDQATLMEAQDQDARDLWVQIETLKHQLASRSV